MENNKIKKDIIKLQNELQQYLNLTDRKSLCLYNNGMTINFNELDNINNIIKFSVYFTKFMLNSQYAYDVGNDYNFEYDNKHTIEYFENIVNISYDKLIYENILNNDYLFKILEFTNDYFKLVNKLLNLKSEKIRDYYNNYYTDTYTFEKYFLDVLNYNYNNEYNTYNNEYNIIQVSLENDNVFIYLKDDLLNLDNYLPTIYVGDFLN